jgi:hypothetical protein
MKEICMKVVIYLFALINFFVASEAVARDLNEALRDRQVFCSQFIIHDPDPKLALDSLRDCCAFSQNFRDCQMYNGIAIEHW